MKKIIFIFLIIFIVGCKKDDKIMTIIKETDDYVISINYPITRINKLDNQIEKYVYKEYNIFIKDSKDSLERKELNIDFNKVFRPTYGSVNKKMREVIDLDIILWNIDTMDWRYKSKKKILLNILSQVGDGKIILMYDTKKITYDVLTQLLPKLQDKGYQFVTVSELNKIKKIRDQT